MHLTQCRDLRCDFTGFGLDGVLQGSTGTDPGAARLKNFQHIRQRYLQRPQGANEAQFRKDIRAEQTKAPFRAADGMNEAFIAVEADRLHREARSRRYLTNFEEPCRSHLTLLLGERSS